MAASVPIEPAVVTKLRKEWESHPDRHKGKREYGDAALELRTAFLREVAANGTADLQQFVQTAGMADEPGEIVYLLKDELIGEFISSGDRQHLVELLSAVPANESSYGSIEQSLTRDVSWNRLTDGLTILFDAYDSAQAARVKESNYLAVWGALGDAPLRTGSQDEYMRAARSWYALNRDRLQRCDHYDHDDIIMWKQGHLSGDRPCNLFSPSSTEGR